ncbi:MAG: tetratricopeptide repeat protein, partial [Gemmatimonadota bacterium]
EVSRAEDAYRRAIDSLTVLTEEFPDRLRYRDLLAVSYNWLGLNLAPRDRPAARSAYDTALSIADALVEEAPDESEFRRHRARTLYNRGILLAGDTATQSDAEADYRAAIDDLEALVAGASGRGSDPGDPVDEYRRELARSHNNLANLLRITGRESEALRSFERAIALLDDVSERTDLRGPKQELAVYHNNLANFHWERGEDDRAVVRSQEALALFEELAAPLASLDLERASSYSTLGIILLDQGRLEQAESALRSSLSIWERLEASSESLTRDPVFQYRFGFTLFDLAQASLQRGDTAEASRHLGRALDHHLATLRAVEGDSPMTDLCYAYEDLAGRFGGDTGSRPGDGAAGSPESRPEDGPGGDATAEISRTVAQALEACAAG